MNNIDVQTSLDDCKVDLDKVRAIIDSLGGAASVVPYLNMYAIIRACGAIEVGFKTIIADFCSTRSKMQIKNFIDIKVRDNSMNPRYSLICKLLEDFDENWAIQLKTRINTNIKKIELLSSLESLVNCRNDFAHGGNPSATIYDTIKYFEDARIVVEILDEIVC